MPRERKVLRICGSKLAAVKEEVPSPGPNNNPEGAKQEPQQQEAIPRESSSSVVLGGPDLPKMDSSFPGCPPPAASALNTVTTSARAVSQSSRGRSSSAAPRGESSKAASLHRGPAAFEGIPDQCRLPPGRPRWASRSGKVLGEATNWEQLR